MNTFERHHVRFAEKHNKKLQPIQIIRWLSQIFFGFN